MNDIKTITDIIKKSQRILISTHRDPDGDGLGSEFALLHALTKIGKTVSVFNLDRAASKYDFLKDQDWIEIYQSEIPKCDCAIIVDTNDNRLLSPMYEKLEKNCKEIIFLDHHPVLEKGPKPTEHSLINIKAASTGELTYDLIKNLNIELDSDIALGLYTSLVFDTQMFRYIRNSPKSHLIASELLKFDIQPEKIHRSLFGDFTKNKLLFIARSLNQVEFFENDTIAYLRISEKDLKALQLTKEHTKDLIDMIMNIDTIEAAVLVREIEPTEYKLSFRSKGKIEVLKVAEALGGGGHIYASGAYIPKNTLDINKIKHDSVEALVYSLKHHGTKK